MARPLPSQVLQGLGPGKAQEQESGEDKVRELMMAIYGHPHQEPNDHVLREVMRKLEGSASEEEKNWVMEEVRGRSVCVCSLAGRNTVCLCAYWANQCKLRAAQSRGSGIGSWRGVRVHCLCL